MHGLYKGISMQRKLKAMSLKQNGHHNQGKKKAFPEIDKAAWFTMDEAKNKIIGGAGTVDKRNWKPNWMLLNKAIFYPFCK